MWSHIICWPPKHDYVLFECSIKKLLFSTLNIMILQMVKNEDLRIGEHVDIQVRYKILQLEVPKRVSTLKNLACFKMGLI